MVTSIFFSPTDTTKKVCIEIAKHLDSDFKEINITNPEHRNTEFIFNETDVVIVGAPVYSGRIPDFIAEYFSTFKGNNTLLIPIVLYGNRDYEDALLELNEIFKKNGFNTIAAGAFIGEHSYTSEVAKGRPDVADLQIAKKFSLGIKKKLSDIRSKKVNLHDVKVNGNYPYRERKETLPLGPMTRDNCIDCKVCINTCPLGIISNDPKIVDEEKCIRCFSCVKRCPVNAKYFDERLDGVKKWLIDNCSQIRKEPEMFI